MRGLYLCLSILTQVSSSPLEVIGLLGTNVTLPCRYDAQTHGSLAFCWGRDVVPRFKCSSTIFYSEDGVGLFSESPKYQVLGSVTDGDVSLTILDAQLSDAGLYGCRLEIPGWFNDEKFNRNLVMVEGNADHPASTEQPVTPDWTLPAENLTTPMIETVKLGNRTLEVIRMTITEEKFKSFLEMGNIARMAVVFLFSIIIIIILVFVFWKRQSKRQDLNTTTAENIYEVL